MRRTSLTCLAFASLALASCSSNQSGTPEGPAAQAAAPIVYGSADNTHTAVVALLNPDGGGYDQCSGTIVQVSGGLGYVLTAAHCCSPAPTIVILNNDYSVGVPYINSSNPPAPTYAVNAGSVKVDPAYVPTTTHDFCMLTFNAPTGTPSIPVATGNDGLSVGTTVEYVGFGVTTDATNNSNTLRNHASAPVDQAVAASTFSYHEGGGIGGPCEGDSGGPALLPSGAAQSSQKVVGTTSYGSSKCQPSGSTGVDMRVTSATGPGGFIITYLGGSSSSSSTSSSSSSSSTSSSGGGAPTTCGNADGNFGCCEGNTLYYCATGSTTITKKVCSSTTVCGWSAANGYYGCVPPPGGADPSGTYPLTCGGGSTSTSSSSSSTGSVSTSSSSSTSSSGTTTSCGITTGDPTCDDCINTSCCAQATACANDTNCIPCLQANPICTTDQPATDLNNCLNNDCVAACSGGGTGGGGAGGGSAGTTTTGTGAGNTTGTGTGTTTSGGNGGASTTTSGGSGGSLFGAGGSGTTGAGNGNGTGTGTGNPSGGTGSPGNSSGCNVASGTGSAPSAPGSLAGMLLGAALVLSRRRR